MAMAMTSCSPPQPPGVEAAGTDQVPSSASLLQRWASPRSFGHGNGKGVAGVVNGLQPPLRISGHGVQLKTRQPPNFRDRRAYSAVAGSAGAVKGFGAFSTVRQVDTSPCEVVGAGSDLGKLLPVGTKRLKRSNSPYTRSISRSELELLDGRLSNQHFDDDRVAEVAEAFSPPPAVWPRPTRRQSAPCAMLSVMPAQRQSPTATASTTVSHGIQSHLGSTRRGTPIVSGVRLPPVFPQKSGTIHKQHVAVVDVPPKSDTTAPDFTNFDLRSLAREMPGTPDSGTSSMDGAASLFTFTASPRPNIASTRRAEVLTLVDDPDMVARPSGKRRASGGNSCDFGRMLRSSNESMDSFGSTETLSLRRPLTGRRRRPGSAPSKRPMSAPTRRLKPVQQRASIDDDDRPITAGNGFAFREHLWRPVSAVSNARSDIGSSIQGSRPSTGEQDISEFQLST